MADFKLHIGNKCVSSWSLRPWVAMKHLGIPFEEGVSAAAHARDGGKSGENLAERAKCRC